MKINRNHLYLLLAAVLLIVLGVEISRYVRNQRVGPEAKVADPVNLQPIDFLASLPYSATDFTIKLVPNTGATLLITPNHVVIDEASPPEAQLAAQWSTYEKEGLAAVEYIKAHGGGLENFSLTFWLQAHWPAGKSLNPQ